MGLAIKGGVPVRSRPWPKWPRADSNTEANVVDVLRSGRWAISGLYDGRKSYERRFSEAFSSYNDSKYCVPVANGSSALIVALQALGVKQGDEVIVPALTWVACASSVVSIGAVPILVDIDPRTLCISIDAARAAITGKTKAIMIVHLYCSIADVDRFVALSKESGIPLIEDCSQSHGAIFRGRRVGTFGALATFSMQQSKVLTSGEGGAVITNDENLYDIMQQLRADGRRYADSQPRIGHMELEEIGSIQGQNMCLSEFQAAVLCDRLQHLDDENKHRERMANILSTRLENIEGITPPSRHKDANLVTYYKYCLRLSFLQYNQVSVDAFCDALGAELGILVETTDDPLNSNILYRPLLSPRVSRESALREKLDPQGFFVPEATLARKECLLLPHQIFLGDDSDIDDVVSAFRKVKANIECIK